MNGIFRFLASRYGRIARIVAGVLLIIIGLGVISGSSSLAGWIVAVIGLGPLAAGVFDVCLLAPLMGLPFRGPDLRAKLGGKAR